ncbi:MAG: transglycosylase domain-containing protein [Bacteroidales bacterium]|nr:transglycosylase domain-containing protein [Bacteroidales bacterium]
MKQTRSKLIKPFWLIYSIGICSIVLIFFMISRGWLGFMPSFEELENPKTNLATEVYSVDGKLLGKYYIENRTNCKYKDLSPNLVDALTATEDARFRKHSGVDGRALARVFFGVITFHQKGGGSTISQQLAKNLFPREPNAGKLKLVLTKFKEWVVAARLERSYSKDEIMAMYFNTVDFGSNSLGITSAAATYFAKTPSELSVEESAVLVGMLKATSKYNPRRNPENALNRRNVVLDQMRKYDYLSHNECDSIQQIPIDISRFKAQTHITGLATYFREYLRLYLNNWCKTHPKDDGTFYDIYRDGLKIYTTIDSRMQKHAEEAVYDHVSEYLQPTFFSHWKGYKNAPFYRITDEETEQILTAAMKRSDRYQQMKNAGASMDEIKKAFATKVAMKVYAGPHKPLKDTVMTPMDSIRYMKSFLQCGLMAVESNTGFVKAYVGGTDYEYFQFDHVKLSKRQVGSTFKPYVYTVAMQSGEYDPCTEVPNIPVTFSPGDWGVIQSWTPRNSGYPEDEGKMLPLKKALAHSLNQVSAYIMKQFGPQAVVDLVHNMGMTSDIPVVPAICLGACELTLYEQVGAINCFPNKGVYVEPIFITKICDREGNEIAKFTPKTNEAIDESTAYKTVRLMQGVVDYGTGWSLRGSKYQLSFPLGGKTGTTDNQSDGWFVGYTPVLTCGVWVGCEDRAAHFRSTALGQGSRTALPVFALFMKKCYSDPELPYHLIIENPEKYPGRDFVKPDKFTGDENGCNEERVTREELDFD